MEKKVVKMEKNLVKMEKVEKMEKILAILEKIIVTIRTNLPIAAPLCVFSSQLFNCF